MSSSDRRTLILSLAALAGLSACGYRPVLAPGGPGAGLIGRVALRDPSSRYDFALVEALEARLGRGGEGAYRLDYTISVESERVAVTQQNVTTRYNLVGQVDYRLRAAEGGRVASGRVNSFVSYSASGTVIATEAAQRDAEERLMRVLADSLVTRLYAELAGQAA